MSNAAAERRLNQLTGDWVLVSPHRMSRPWQGAVSSSTLPRSVKHDPECYLCAGNARVGGARNPDYDGVYIFPNDFPALLELPGAKMSNPLSQGRLEAGGPGDLLVREPESGICRVICYSPDHGLTLSRMTPEQIRPAVDAWSEQFSELAARPDISSVTIFENRGEMMGASNPHPHGQIWATAAVPNELAREDTRQFDWYGKYGEPMLLSYLRRELEAGERIIYANDTFVALIPFWAAWPFETLILPREQVSGLDELSQNQREGLAEVLARLTAGYDALFDAPFPYTMGFHQRPTDGRKSEHFTLHAHFFPPLLRSASIRKFMVGFEMLGMPQRDLTPEAAAERLRAVL